MHVPLRASPAQAALQGELVSIKAHYTGRCPPECARSCQRQQRRSLTCPLESLWFYWNACK